MLSSVLYKDSGRSGIENDDHYILSQGDWENVIHYYDQEKGTTVEDRLNFYLVFHEAYHAGQLEILRELALAHK